MINWNDWTPLTREEFDSFIEKAIPFLKDMEMKNGWDFFVNDMSIGWFCERFLLEAFEYNEYEEHQKHNQKVKDMLSIYNLLVDGDWTKENETLRANKGTEIWKLILDRVNAVADSVF